MVNKDHQISHNAISILVKINNYGIYTDPNNSSSVQFCCGHVEVLRVVVSAIEREFVMFHADIHNLYALYNLTTDISATLA